MAASTQLCYSLSVENKFLVGANIIVERDGKILFGLRKSGFSEGNWGLPGGHVEIGESLANAAARELFEETGMTAERFVFVNLVNRPNEGAHYVLTTFAAHNVIGEPKLCEPDRCEEWRWFDFLDIPKNVVESHHEQTRLYREGIIFTE